MSFKAETFKRVGNGRMGASIKQMAGSCDLCVQHYSATGWVLKDITITVYGHVDDIGKFKKMLPKGL
jgi:hypothetical protein